MFTTVVVLNNIFTHLSVLILTSAPTKHVDNSHVCGPFTSNQFQSTCKFQQELHWASISGANICLKCKSDRNRVGFLRSRHHKRLKVWQVWKLCPQSRLYTVQLKVLKLRDLRRNDKKRTPKFLNLKKKSRKKEDEKWQCIRPCFYIQISLN